MKHVAAAAAAALRIVGVAAVHELANALEDGIPRARLPSVSLFPEFGPSARAVLDAQLTDQVPDRELACYLHGVADGYQQRADALTVELVWTGPVSHHTPVRTTAQVLVGLVEQARHQLLMMTYSAAPHAQLRTGLGAALDRGVSVDIVIETLQGAGSALTGAEPAAAFAGLRGARLWQWAPSARPAGAKMHAKIAVADRAALFVSSANLTVSGLDSNIEAGVLVRGGSAPGRAAEHFAGLVAAGEIVALGREVS